MLDDGEDADGEEEVFDDVNSHAGVGGTGGGEGGGGKSGGGGCQRVLAMVATKRRCTTHTHM